MNRTLMAAVGCLLCMPAYSEAGEQRPAEGTVAVHYGIALPGDPPIPPPGTGTNANRYSGYVENGRFNVTEGETGPGTGGPGPGGSGPGSAYPPVWIKHETIFNSWLGDHYASIKVVSGTEGFTWDSDYAAVKGGAYFHAGGVPRGTGVSKSRTTWSAKFVD